MAVYTDVSDEELSDFLTRYDIGALVSCKGIAEGVENSNFLLGTETGRFILTLYEKRVNEGDLPFFLGLMDHLADRGINCPQPVRDRDGEALGRLAGRPATIVSFLDGMWVKRPEVSHCGQVGEALARLHKAGEGFSIRRRNGLGPDGWPPLYAGSADRADEVLTGLGGEVETELAFLQSNWPKDLPEGVIHADLFPDNVFFLKGQLSGLIDFYFACNDFLVYDLAICLNAWCFEPDGAFNITKGRAMLSGYTSGRPLTDAEMDALPVLCRGAALRFLLTRLYDWLMTPPGALVRKKDPLEYYKKLRFHRTATTASAYGLELAGSGA
ncbi:homoserine kinase [Pleomorphomonas diazotrophica]|uniref:Homoserine kinase n=1 Tax=Pleomorphomonas diazotrophica TaxID=1166257 RepID=A0A1I4TST1_9HYPH|nr:homoserine kinase [Pleomorphomonas diazotrophica]PKR87655.1 homoserine kinase [Pleomorphomonas diazotrophica]SFM79784.1 homoserine kinase [Pleomorphomonas diazotrophica]